MNFTGFKTDVLKSGAVIFLRNAFCKKEEKNLNLFQKPSF